jgi:hypothetical protein
MWLSWKDIRLSDTAVFSVCGEVLAYSFIGIWLVTWAIKRIKALRNPLVTPVLNTLNPSDRVEYVPKSTGELSIPEDVRNFMISLRDKSMGDSFLPSLIPQSDLKYLGLCLMHGLIIKEYYQSTGDMYTITDKGKSLT